MTGPHKISEYFASQQNTKAVVALFSKYFAKLLQTSNVWPLPSKTIMPTCTNFDDYLNVKTPSLTSFFRYCKDIANLQTCCFEYFDHTHQ